MASRVLVHLFKMQFYRNLSQNPHGAIVDRWSTRRCAMDNFRKMDIIDVGMAKDENNRFEKGLEQRVGRMEMKGKNDSVSLIRDKGYKLSVLIKDVYEWIL